jgi:hypothetical protein
VEGGLWGDGTAAAVSDAKTLEMDNLIALNNAQRQARDTQVINLLGDESINLSELLLLAQVRPECTCAKDGRYGRKQTPN